VLRASLVREEDKLFGAVPIVVGIDDDFQAFALKSAQAEIGHFQVLLFVVGYGYTGLGQHSDRSLLCR